MRINELDGVRGLAALQVALSHMAMVSGPVGLMFDGNTAVIMFFVLSGLCLSLPYVSNKKLHLGEYFVKRVFRIYPALAVSVLVVVSAHGLFNANGILSTPLAEWADWGRDGWSPFELWQYFILLYPHTNYMNFNPVLWSLVVEINLSIQMPLAIAFVKWCRTTHAIAACVVLQVASSLLSGLSETLATELRWLGLFMAGTILAKNMPAVIDTVRESRPLKACLALAGVVGYVLPNILFSPNTQYHYLAVMSGIASTCLIIVTVSSHRSMRFTRSVPLQFFGKISYSLYLIHFPIYLAVFSLFYEDYGAFFAAFVSLALSLSIAFVSSHWVEAPSTRLGAMVGSRLRPHTKGA